jgi:hypothetical protein
VGASARGPLQDCWFTLAALEGGGEAGEREHMRDLIRQAGGRIFDAQRINLLPGGCSTWAVCPISFPLPRQGEALQRPDFRLGARFPPRKRRTKRWKRAPAALQAAQGRLHTVLQCKMPRLTSACITHPKEVFFSRVSWVFPAACSAGGAARDALLGGAQHRARRADAGRAPEPRDVPAAAARAAPARHGQSQVHPSHLRPITKPRA